MYIYKTATKQQQQQNYSAHDEGIGEAAVGCCALDTGTSTAFDGFSVCGCVITDAMIFGVVTLGLVFPSLLSAMICSLVGDCRGCDGCSRGCLIFPQSFWWLSQSLCWQKDPQYLAMLHPLQVSLALRPQLQQCYRRNVRRNVRCMSSRS